MNRKLRILIFFVVLPVILVNLYNYYFEYAGNWLEDYQNYFQIGFLLTSLMGSAFLGIISKRDRNETWFLASMILFAALLIYLFIGIIMMNISFGAYPG